MTEGGAKFENKNCFYMLVFHKKYSRQHKTYQGTIGTQEKPQECQKPAMVIQLTIPDPIIGPYNSPAHLQAVYTFSTLHFSSPSKGLITLFWQLLHYIINQGTDHLGPSWAQNGPLKGPCEKGLLWSLNGPIS